MPQPLSPWYIRLTQLLSAIGNRNRVVRILEGVQNIIVVSLCVGLFCVMVIQLRAMFISLLPPLNFKAVTADILFLLILVELFRLLIIYLQEQRVSIGVAVEVAIVSVLREVIVRGVLEVPWSQILSACAFLMVMAVLLVVRVWLPLTFDGVDPERRLVARHQTASEETNNNHTMGQTHRHHPSLGNDISMS
jgi:uncharacterized membrane protein (DUF373 family)